MKLNTAAAVIISAFFGMVGGLGQAYISKPNPAVQQPPDNPTTQSLPAPSGDDRRTSGEWIDGLQAKVAYQADTDGFVAAYTGGGKPAKGADVMTGPSTDKLAVRDRVGGSFDGAVVPVRKGQYWLVQPWSEGFVKVQWLSTPR